MAAQPDSAPRSKLLAALALLGGVPTVFMLIGGIYSLMQERSDFKQEIRYLTDKLEKTSKDAEQLRVERESLTAKIKILEQQAEISRKQVEDSLDKMWNATLEADRFKNTAKNLMSTLEAQCDSIKSSSKKIERELSIPDSDVFALKGERRQEALDMVRRYSEEYQQCMSQRAAL